MLFCLGNEDLDLTFGDDSNLNLSGRDSVMLSDASQSDLADESPCWDMNDSLYVPTPQRNFRCNLSHIASHKEAFMDLSELGRFMKTVNRIRGCITPGCTGELTSAHVRSSGLGGALSMSYVCDGCPLQGTQFITFAVYEHVNTSEISVCVQVAFILAGCTHATYYKTLQHALGIEAVSMHSFLNGYFPLSRAWSMKCARLPSKK